MTWAAVFAGFFVSHLLGDFLLQTEWQAITKGRGLSDPEGRRALLSHVTTYTLAFVPFLVWIAVDRSVLGAIGIAALIAVPHIVVDDGRLVARWMRDVKHAPNPDFGLRLMVDQSWHIVCLLAAAMIAAS